MGTASSLQALRDLSRSACARSSSHVAAFRPCWAAGACASARPQTGPACCARSCASWGQNKRFCICLMWPTQRVSQNAPQSSSKWTQKPSVSKLLSAWSTFAEQSSSSSALDAPMAANPTRGQNPGKTARLARARACTARATTAYPGTHARATTKKQNYQQQQKQPKCESVAAATATAAVAAAAANSNNSGAGSSNKSNRVRAGSESSSNSCKTKRKQLQQQQKR